MVKKSPRKPYKNALAGRRYGKLLILRSVPYTDRCLVRCDFCGKTKSMLKVNVRKSRSCGCQKIAFITEASTRHGQSYSPEYRCFVAMHNRCENPHNKKFPLYGGRGIKVSRQFSGKNGFVRFIACMGPRPSSKHSIDRIRVNGNYEPGNVRWATVLEQRHNQRRVLEKAA